MAGVVRLLDALAVSNAAALKIHLLRNSAPSRTATLPWRSPGRRTWRSTGHVSFQYELEQSAVSCAVAATFRVHGIVSLHGADDCPCDWAALQFGQGVRAYRGVTVQSRAWRQAVLLMSQVSVAGRLTGS